MSNFGIDYNALNATIHGTPAAENVPATPGTIAAVTEQNKELEKLRERVYGDLTGDSRVIFKHACDTQIAAIDAQLRDNPNLSEEQKTELKAMRAEWGKVKNVIGKWPANNANFAVAEFERLYRVMPTLSKKLGLTENTPVAQRMHAVHQLFHQARIQNVCAQNDQLEPLLKGITLSTSIHGTSIKTIRLVEQGANPNMVVQVGEGENTRYYTPLQLAIQAGNANNVSILLRRGAKLVIPAADNLPQINMFDVLLATFEEAKAEGNILKQQQLGVILRALKKGENGQDNPQYTAITGDKKTTLEEIAKLTVQDETAIQSHNFLDIHALLTANPQKAQKEAALKEAIRQTEEKKRLLEQERKKRVAVIEEIKTKRKAKYGADVDVSDLDGRIKAINTAFGAVRNDINHQLTQLNSSLQRLNEPDYTPISTPGGSTVMPGLQGQEPVPVDQTGKGTPQQTTTETEPTTWYGRLWAWFKRNWGWVVGIIGIGLATWGGIAWYNRRQDKKDAKRAAQALANAGNSSTGNTGTSTGSDGSTFNETATAMASVTKGMVVTGTPMAETTQVGNTSWGTNITYRDDTLLGGNGGSQNC